MRYARLIKALLAVLAIGFLVYYVDPAAMADAATGANPWWIAAAVLLMPANVFLEGSVWHALARRIDPRTTLGESFGALLTGYALGFFTPGRTGEFAGRAYYVRHEDKWEIAAAVAVQRLLDMAVAVSVGTVVLFAFLETHAPSPAGLWQAFAVLGSVISVVLLSAGLLPGAARRVAGRVLPFRAVRTRLAFLQELSTAGGARILGLNLARFCVYTTQFVLLVRALVPSAELATTYMGVVLVFFAKFLIPSFTFMDLGIREGAAVFFLGMMEFPEAAALNASLLLFTINLLLPAAVGVRFVMRMRLGLKSEPNVRHD